MYSLNLKKSLVLRFSELSLVNRLNSQALGLKMIQRSPLLDIARVQVSQILLSSTKSCILTKVQKIMKRRHLLMSLSIEKKSI